MVGFSGGSDSTALLKLTLDWATPRGRRVIAVVVDHRLNPESGAWTRRALRAAEDLGANARACEWIGPKPSTGLPAAARRARHRLLAGAARAAGARVVLLGHTLDDLAEAERMRAAGSSVGSPAEWGPSPVWPEGRGVFLLRPMLGMERSGLRAWLRTLGLDWIEDPANADLRFARARARVEGGEAVGWMPALPDGLPLLATSTSAPGWGGLELDRSVLAAASPTAAARWVQIAAACASGRETPPDGTRASALALRLVGRDGVVATLGGARFEAGDLVRVTRERGRGGLAAGGPVWDGRFELSGASFVGPLGGRSRNLPRQEQGRLKAVPVAARAALPLVESDGKVTCPVLAERPGLNCRPLAGERLLAACGVIAREAE